MADEWKEYVNDPRMVCKYGTKCYQKNPEHHKTFKHPPQNKRKDVGRNKRRFSPYNRESPRHSPTTHSKDESPDCINKEQVNNDERESIAVPSISKENKADEHWTVEIPDNITMYDKNTDNSIIKELFLVEMPEDFFKFYECINSFGKSVEDTLASVNLVPIGPYELLLGKLPKLENKELYLIHWRFFYDPPEFQVI